MYYSKKHDLAYVRVPCTASTTITRSIKWDATPDVDHAMARNFKHEFKSKRIVGFVRHPVEWVGAVWTAHHRGWDVWGLPQGREAVKDVEDWHLAEKMHTIFDWLTDEQGNLLVNEVWRVEDLGKFYDSLGLKEPLDRRNVTSERSKKAHLPLSGKAVEIIKQRFTREYKYYKHR